MQDKWIEQLDVRELIHLILVTFGSDHRGPMSMRHSGQSLSTQEFEEVSCEGGGLALRSGVEGAGQREREEFRLPALLEHSPQVACLKSSCLCQWVCN